MLYVYFRPCKVHIKDLCSALQWERYSCHIWERECWARLEYCESGLIAQNNSCEISIFNWYRKHVQNNYLYTTRDTGLLFAFILSHILSEHHINSNEFSDSLSASAPPHGSLYLCENPASSTCFPTNTALWWEIMFLWNFCLPQMFSRDIKLIPFGDR